jgi:hypothetical protein
MTTLDFLMFILTTIGMAHIIVDGSIFETPRKLIKDYSAKAKDSSFNLKIILTAVVLLACVLWTFKFGFTGLPYFGALMVIFILWADFGSVVDCYLCSGTWAGFLMGYIWLTQEPLQIFACGCAGGFVANLAAMILNWIEASTIVKLPSDKEE